MEHIKGFTFVFFNAEFEPVNQCVVYAFVCAEAGDADSAVRESPFFGREQAWAGAKDTDLISS